MTSIPTVNMKQTGMNIKRLRMADNITVAAIQIVLGFSTPQAIFKWQRGDSLPTIDNLVILSRMFHVSIDDILAVD